MFANNGPIGGGIPHDFLSAIGAYSGPSGAFGPAQPPTDPAGANGSVHLPPDVAHGFRRPPQPLGGPLPHPRPLPYPGIHPLGGPYPGGEDPRLTAIKSALAQHFGLGPALLAG